MFTKVMAAIIWARMRRRYLDGDYAGAAKLAEQYRETGVKSLVFDAFDATLDVLNHRYDSAAEKFRSVAEQTEDAANNNGRYIHEFAMYSLCLHDNLKHRAEGHRRAALSAGASPYVRKSIPIASGPLRAEWFQ